MLKDFSGTGLTAECYLNIRSSGELIRGWARQIDLRPYFQIDFFDSPARSVVLFVQKRVDGTFRVGLLEGDHLNPNLWFPDSFQSETELHAFIRKLHRATGVLTHPLQQRVEGVEISSDLENLAKTQREKRF